VQVHRERASPDWALDFELEFCGADDPIAAAAKASGACSAKQVIATTRRQLASPDPHANELLDASFVHGTADDRNSPILPPPGLHNYYAVERLQAAPCRRAAHAARVRSHTHDASWQTTYAASVAKWFAVSDRQHIIDRGTGPQRANVAVFQFQFEFEVSE
jgi:hypothetical protein